MSSCEKRSVRSCINVERPRSETQQLILALARTAMMKILLAMILSSQGFLPQVRIARSGGSTTSSPLVPLYLCPNPETGKPWGSIPTVLQIPLVLLKSRIGSLFQDRRQRHLCPACPVHHLKKSACPTSWHQGRVFNLESCHRHMTHQHCQLRSGA